MRPGSPGEVLGTSVRMLISLELSELVRAGRGGGCGGGWTGTSSTRFGQAHARPPSLSPLTFSKIAEKSGPDFVRTGPRLGISRLLRKMLARAAIRLPSACLARRTTLALSSLPFLSPVPRALAWYFMNIVIVYPCLPPSLSDLSGQPSQSSSWSTRLPPFRSTRPSPSLPHLTTPATKEAAAATLGCWEGLQTQAAWT